MVVLPVKGCRYPYNKEVKMKKLIWILACMGVFLVVSNASAAQDVKVDLTLNKDCILIVKYTNQTKAILNGTLFSIKIDETEKKKDQKISIAPGKTESIDTKIKIPGGAWVSVQTSFGEGTTVGREKTLECKK